jgi:hypothetical protein
MGGRGMAGNSFKSLSWFGSECKVMLRSLNPRPGTHLSKESALSDVQTTNLNLKCIGLLLMAEFSALKLSRPHLFASCDAPSVLQLESVNDKCMQFMVETMQYLPSEMKQKASRFSQYTLQITAGSKSHEIPLDDELMSY